MCRALRYIEDHLTEPITLRDIASVAAVSEYHLIRLFKKQVGFPPLRYVTRRRIDLAKTRLSSTTLSIARIAVGCGFSSQSHFTTAFKSVTGTTPGAFRRAFMALLLLVTIESTIGWSELLELVV